MKKKSPIQSYMLSLKTYWSRRKQLIDRYWWILPVLIFILAVFLHFYHLNTDLLFNADPALQSNAIHYMWQAKQPAIDGPGASLEGGVSYGLTHGAYYYYLFLIPGLLTNFNPLGFGVFVALLSIAAGVIMFFAFKEIFGKWVAVLSYFLYTISFLITFYGRLQINPDNIPFFTALSLFAFFKFMQGKSKYYLILLFFSISSITQLHVSGYIFIPVLLIFIPSLWKQCKDKHVWVLAVIAFLIPWIPTIFQQIHYHYPILKFVTTTLIQHGDKIGVRGHTINAYYRSTDLFEQVMLLGSILPVVVTLAGVGLVIRKALSEKRKEIRLSIYFLLAVLGLSIIMFGWYPGDMHSDYGEHLFIIFPLLTALFSIFLIERKETIAAGIALLLFITVQNVAMYTHEYVGGKHYYQIENRICQDIKSKGNQNYQIRMTANSPYVPYQPGDLNPIYVTYVCDTVYHFGPKQTNEKQVTYTITTDFTTYTLSSD